MSSFWKIIFSVLTLVLFFLVFLGLLNRWAFPDTGWDLSGEGEKIELNPGVSIMQKFEASRNNLSRIRILFGRSYNKDGGEINLELADESCKNPIREEHFKRSSIQSEGYYDFKFSKISGSKDKSFCLIVDFNPEKEKFKKLNLFLGSNLIPENQLFFGNEEMKNQSLAMRPAYQANGFRENVSELNQRISQYKPWFLKNIYLYVASFSFIFLTFFLLILVIWF